VQLARVLGLRTVVSTSAGLTFATSCFVAAAQLAAHLLGDAGWIAVLVAGLLSLASAAAFSELSSMYPSSAGLRLYIRQAFGERVAIVFSLFYMLMVTAVVGAEAYVLGRVLAHAVPAVPPFAWIVAVLAVATLVNLRGLKVAGSFQDLITYGMIASLVAISLVGLGRLGWSLPAPFALGGGAKLFQAVSAGIFLFIGFEWVTPLAEEVTGSRLLARGMFVAVGLLSVVYALFTAAMAPWLSNGELRSSPIPHVLFGERLLGGAGMAWMTLTSLGASSTTFNAGLATISRFLYASAREDLLPRALARIDPRRVTPSHAIVAVSLVGLVVSGIVFMTGSYLALVYAGAATESLAWAMAGAVLIALRRKQPSMPRPFKVKAGLLVGAATAVIFGALGIGALTASPGGAAVVGGGLLLCWAHVRWVVPGLKLRAAERRRLAVAARPARRPRPTEAS
jgi:amino acid transporter